MAMFGICRNCCPDCVEWTPCHLCCRCVPKRLCVTTEAGSSCTFVNNQSTFLLSPGTDHPTWEGSVACGDLTVDLKFTIEPDAGGTCYVYLESTCLGLLTTGRLSQPVNIGGCFNSGQTVTFTIDPATGCGDDNCGPLTITLRAIELIADPSGGCGCLTRCVCAILTIDGDSGDGQLCWDDVSGKWTGDIILCGTLASVTVEPSYDGYAHHLIVHVDYNSASDDVDHQISDGGCSSDDILLFEEGIGLDFGGGITGTLCLTPQFCSCTQWPCGVAPCKLYATLTTSCNAVEVELSLNARGCSQFLWVWTGSGDTLNCLIDIMGYPTCNSKGAPTLSLQYSVTNGCGAWSFSLNFSGGCIVNSTEPAPMCDPVMIDLTFDTPCDCLDDLEVSITE